MTNAAPYPLPDGISSRRVEGVNGLSMHILEAGAGNAKRVLLLHGFPELAYSWRKVLPALAEAGYHAIAPDQRGYGLTTGHAPGYDVDLQPYFMPSLATDVLALMDQLGWDKVDCLIGHDFGSPLAAWTTLLYEERFGSVILMSAPFGGPPSKPLGAPATIHEDMAALTPARKHYHWYYSTEPASQNMTSPPEGLTAFFRAYYHVKSADWPHNKPFTLGGWTAEELAKLPTYYIMELDKGMAETVLEHAPTKAEIASCSWLTEEELAVYVGEYGRNSFQVGLNWYRAGTNPEFAAKLSEHHGKRIDIPSLFIAGAADWGVRQKPGDFENMQSSACSDFRGAHLIDGAGHWVQQEQPEETNRLILNFLQSL